MLHHGTIRKYTAALIDLFNNMEIQYKDSNGNTLSRSIPLVYSSREKSKLLDEKVTEQLSTGNTNVLPRASISLVTMAKMEQRVTNKNVKINTYATEDSFEYMYNSVPYEFTYQVDVMCRGMNEATQIIEQLAPKFNPTVNIDVWDATNLNEPTRIPVRLLDFSLENDEYDELYANIFTVSMGISLVGNLYPPIKTVERVKEFNMYLNQQDGDYFNKKTILGWDVNDSGELENATEARVEDSSTFTPNVISLNSDNPIVEGINNIYAIYEDGDNKLSELNFTWSILSGNATVTPDLDKAVLDIATGESSVEVELKITDAFGNYNSLSKIFTV
jgi:hypothetical protein